MNLDFSGTENIIFDTDIGCDCDDAGALAVLHNLCNLGAANILAIVACTCSYNSSKCIEIINKYYNRSDIPVGQLNYYDTLKSAWIDVYSEKVSELFGGIYNSKSEYKDSITLLRETLSKQPDNSVTYVTTGPQTNMALLLMSMPDDISPLNGSDLVKNKIKNTVIMGGCFKNIKDALVDENTGEFNIIGDIKSAALVAEEWETPIVYSGYEIGNSILCGTKLLKENDDSNPVRFSYKVHCNTERCSWDQTAVLYGVFPNKKFWDISEQGDILIDSHGVTKWVHGTKKRSYLIENDNLLYAKEVIEELMSY